MVKKIISISMAAALLFSVGCAKNSDIDDLQEQIQNLEGRLTQSEAALQANLLAQISDLQAVIASLEGANTAQMAELEALQDMVEQNANDIYYGNVISPEQFDEVLAQGATIVTGDVVISRDVAAKLVNVKLIGGDLEVNSEATLSNLEVVVGAMMVNEATVTTVLTSAGDLELNANIEAPELTAVTGNIVSERKEMVTSFMAPKLGFANSINIEGEAQYNMFGQVTLVMTDFKVADGISVIEDFILTKVVSNSDLVVANVPGHFQINEGRWENITYTGESVGDFKVSGITNIVAVNASELTSANSITVTGNSEDYRNPTVDHGLYLMDFDKLETVTSFVKISGNGSLQEVDTFNALTTIKGENLPSNTDVLEVRDGGSKTTKFNAFNALNDLGSDVYSSIEIRINSGNITAFDKVMHVNNFAQFHITSADDVEIFANLETIAGELNVNFTGVAGSIDALSNFKHFTRFNPTIKIGMPYNQADIAAHISKNADVYKPFCDMIQGLSHTLASDMRSVTSKFSHLQNGTTQRTNYGTFELLKSTSKQYPYARQSDYTYSDVNDPNLYWTEAIAGITSSCM